MIQTIKNNLVILLAGFGLAIAAALVPVTANAQDTNTTIQESVNCGASDISLNQSGCSSPAGSSDDISNVIRTVINIFSAVVGSVSVIMIIVGGFKYITSGGDSNNVSGAKNTIMYAIVGLVIVAFAQIIVQFVLERSTV